MGERTNPSMSNPMEASYDFEERQTQRICNWDDHEFRNLRSTMEGSIRKGQSFKDGSNLSTLMKDKKYSIVVGLQISNWTRYPLVDPHAFNESGYLSSAVIDINPNKQEALIAHKYGYTPSGSSGLLSWRIHGTNQRLLVVWSSPYFGSNSLAIGFTKEGTERHDDEWYKTIIHNKTDDNIEFKIHTFDNSTHQIVVKDKSGQFEVKGSMGNSSKPEISIILRPRNVVDLSTTYQH